MTRALTISISFALLLCLGTASAGGPLQQRIEDSTEVLEQLQRIPEKGIPPQLLENAHAVAVLPNVIKAGFIVGGRFGQGILVVRQPDGSWSNPSFIKLAGGSVGFQAGAQGSDLVLVFKTRKGVDNIAKGKLTLGGDLSVAAGPVGRSTSAATDLGLNAEIYSYARNRGLFGGVALDGSVLGIDQKANFAYYESGYSTASNLFNDTAIPAPIEARRFKEVLAAAAPGMGAQPAGSRQAAIKPATPEPVESGARTFGLEDAPPAGDAIF